MSWLARFGKLSAPVSRFVCRDCHVQCRPLLALLGVELGRISGSLARLLALLAAVAPCSLAARLAGGCWEWMSTRWASGVRRSV